MGVSAQKIYNPEADAAADIQKAISLAQKQDKHVLLQVGGNWCPWCIKLHKYFESEAEINKLIKDNYIFKVVNYSKENKNYKVMEQLGFPQRFGFPVLVVLDSKGNRLHTQNSGNLENGSGYDFKKVKSFLYNWRSEALNPINYKK